MSIYLSRLTLNSAASAKALMPLLNPCDPAQAANAHHRLLWSVFSDSHARERDFIWRHDGKRCFFTLSSRPPLNSSLFLPHETRAFEPDLRPGDKLRYVLSANAVRSYKKQREGRGKRVDIVMNLLYEIKSGKRTEKRDDLAQESARVWMKEQGSRYGFRSIQTIAEGYKTLELGRKQNRKARLGILDLKGEIEITNPELFITAVAQGFGRAKTWGCGLMLIRRAR